MPNITEGRVETHRVGNQAASTGVLLLTAVLARSVSRSGDT